MFKHTVKRKVDLPCCQRSRNRGRTAVCRASPSLSVPPLSLQLFPCLYLLHHHPHPVSGETKAQMDVRGETRAKAKEGKWCSPNTVRLGHFSAYLKFARCQTTRVLLYVTVSAMTFIATWLDFTFPFMTPFAIIYITFVEGKTDRRLLVFLKQSVHKLILSLQGIIKPWEMMTESKGLTFAQG